MKVQKEILDTIKILHGNLLCLLHPRKSSTLHFQSLAT